VPAVRQKLHLSSCADFRDRLSATRFRQLLDWLTNPARLQTSVTPIEGYALELLTLGLRFAKQSSSSVFAQINHMLAKQKLKVCPETSGRITEFSEQEAA